MAQRAAAELGFDPAEAFVVGDHTSDLGMGRAVGATTIHVRSGHGEEELVKGAGRVADFLASDLAEAAAIIRGLVEGGRR
jgi:D-glycero-D-manno-heptose 1,7-bisphosphate phosphatase